ncbi:MAG: prepilin-type N-terminal cleavage/methylation domain-containing protein [Rhizobium sp.]|nr:MAG: prepilin-type N-terminal cleavage/methylation domain-containing protein [Rhizobium sp.]
MNRPYKSRFISRAKQAGFTMIEIAMVVVLLVILVALLLPNLTQQSQDTKVSQTTMLVASSMCRAVSSYSVAHNSTISTATATDLSNRGVPATTPFGDTWTVTAAAPNLNITIPMTSVSTVSATNQKDVSTAIQTGITTNSPCSLISSVAQAAGAPYNLTVTFKPQ